MKNIAEKLQSYFIKAVVATGIAAATLVGIGFSSYGLLKGLSIETTLAHIAPISTKLAELEKRQIQNESNTLTMLQSMDAKLNILIASRMGSGVTVPPSKAGGP